MVKAGDKFTRLTVIRLYRPLKSGGGRRAEVQCTCGSNPKTVNCSDLSRGKTKSCGCLQKESTKYKNRVVTKDPTKTLARTRDALDACMTENTGLKKALEKIMLCTEKQPRNKEIHYCARIALRVNYHAEREARQRMAL